ncbi:MAG: tetraacyldisaccharide 4-kinase [Bacteroidota bacterium]
MLRRFLFPFSALWWIITQVRNYLFDKSFIRSYKIPGNSILIGNLSLGGTGKTPMAIYLTNLFKETQLINLLSRGYGRSTKGYIKVNLQHSASEVGDEPMLYARKFQKNVTVAVAEDRALGIRHLRQEEPNSLIILDDAFQHRQITAGFSVLLTSYDSLFVNDLIFPSGNLREPRKGARRANVIVVTKCPKNLSVERKNHIQNRLSVYKKPIFFASISYAEVVPFGNERSLSANILLVTGIANPNPLIEFLTEKNKIEHISFSDHHNFSAKEIQKIHEKFDTFVSESWSILTTEKDFMRLLPVIEKWGLSRYPWFYIPIQLKIENENAFNQLVRDYVSTI